MSTKDQFEEWARFKWPNRVLERSRGWDSQYLDPQIESAWQAWRARDHQNVMKIISKALESAQ